MGLDAAAGAGLDETVVVVGAVERRRSGGVTALRNPAWADGQAGSLQVAVAHARSAGHDAVVVGLGDQPLVARRGLAPGRRADRSPIAVATYGGAAAQPRAAAASRSGTGCPRTGDRGARDPIAGHPELVSDVPCAGTPVDIDTLEDLERWS